MDADEKRASGIFICIQRPAGTAPLNNPSLSGAEKLRPLSSTRISGKSFAAIRLVAKHHMYSVPPGKLISRLRKLTTLISASQPPPPADCHFKRSALGGV